jgi:hypothetical protein
MVRKLTTTIPPLRGPVSRGLNIGYKKDRNMLISEKINGRNRQSFTERKANSKRT